MIWVAVIAAAVGCYLLKLAGVSLPPSVLERDDGGAARAHLTCR